MKSKSLYNLLKPPRGFRLTKSGKVFFAFLLAIIIIAMATGNNLLFLILACFLSFMIVSGIESEMNLRHLEVSRILPMEIYAGRPGVVAYRVYNPKRTSIRLTLADGQRVKVKNVPRGVPENVRQERLFPQRGTYLLGEISFLTTFPYGLFEKSITFGLEDELTVFPEPVPCSCTASSGPSGDYTGSEPDVISHVRPYVPGDPFSSIVWKKQNQGLVSRVVQGGGGTGSLIVLYPGGDMEKKLGMATYLVLELWKASCPFGVSINSYFSGMGISSDHKITILQTLAGTQSINDPDRKSSSGREHVVSL